jgi:hypothetical protein
MVESHQPPITAHLWRFVFSGFKKNYQQSTNDYQLLPPPIR